MECVDGLDIYILEMSLHTYIFIPPISQSTEAIKTGYLPGVLSEH